MSDQPGGLAATGSFAFGPFVLVPARQLLLEHGAPVRIGGRAFDILTALVERPGELVSKRDLLARVWPNVVVEENNLKANMTALRRVLGERHDAPTYIVTVAGRGYRFIAPVNPLASTHPPLVSSSARPLEVRLPAPPARIVGRDGFIDNLRLALEQSRLVSVVGAGGIGKTTVALAVAHLVEDEGVSAATFVDLSRVASGEFVPSALMAALGISPGSDDGLQSVVAILAHRKALIVLDTCEHVLGAVAHVCSFVLAHTSEVRILATSRQVLHAQDEKVAWLEPLELPPPGKVATAAELLKFSAPQLLVERASEKTGYRLLDEDAPAVAQICRRLDGAPLALELVSARLSGRSAEAVLQELDSRFRTLRQDSPAAALRQQTLLATLEWSYALLTKAEATVLRAVSIFAGSFDSDAAVAVVRPQGLTLPETFDAVSGLRAKSMLSLDQSSGELRYRLLDTTRAFAGDLLDSHGEHRAVAESHAHLQLEMLNRTGAEHAAMPGRRWRVTFGDMADDLRKALDWALYRAFDPLLGIRLVAAALPLWGELSLVDESRRNCAHALEEFARIGCSDESLKLKLTVGLASANTYLSSDRESTIDLYKTAIELARGTGDAIAECRSLGALATYLILPGQGNVQETLDAMRQAAIRTKNPAALWNCELMFAERDTLNGDFQSSIVRTSKVWTEIQAYPRDATPIFSEVHPRIIFRVHLGTILWLAGKPGEGVRLVEEAATEALQDSHGLTLIFCLSHGIIWTMTQTRNYERARFYTEQLRNAIYRHGMAAWIPIVECYGESIAALSGASTDPEGLRKALDGLQRGMAQLGHHSYYATLATAMIAIGQAKDAARTLDIVLKNNPRRWVLPELLRVRAATERAFGREADAEASLRDAVQLAAEKGALGWRLRAACDLAELLKDRGALAEARQILAPVYGEFIDGFDTGDLRNARRMLAQLGEPENADH